MNERITMAERLIRVLIMAISTKRGHPIFYDAFYRGWFWFEDGTPIHIEKPCARCGQPPTADGIDACIGGKIDGMVSSCCGHGVTEGIYKWEKKIQFTILLVQTFPPPHIVWSYFNPVMRGLFNDDPKRRFEREYMNHPPEEGTQ